ncbi:unnamed protein product, partial [Porites evermanni]
AFLFSRLNLPGYYCSSRGEAFSTLQIFTFDVIFTEFSLQRLENRHLVKPVLADEKTTTMKGRVSQVGHQHKCLRLTIQLK